MELPAISKDNSRYENSFSEPNASIVSKGATLNRLELSGRLAPGWMGRLSTGLANCKISILRGKAEKVSALEWSAHLELDFFESHYVPLNVDFIRLASETKTPYSAEAVYLDTFKLEKSIKHGGSLFVELTGPDRIGFLAAIINMFSMYSLHPLEIDIETRDNRVYDRFWLKGLGNMPPSESATAAIRDRLTACS